MKFGQWIINVKVEHVVSVFVLSLAFAYLFYISSNKLPADKVNIVGDIKMTALTVVTLIVNYYFGPSRTKKDDKNEGTKENTTGNNEPA